MWIGSSKPMTVSLEHRRGLHFREVSPSVTDDSSSLSLDKIKMTVGHLSDAFSRNDLDLAKDYSIQLQYWENIRRAIVDWVPGKRVEIKH